jgi:hypothetical protein
MIPIGTSAALLSPDGHQSTPRRTAVTSPITVKIRGCDCLSFGFVTRLLFVKLRRLHAYLLASRFWAIPISTIIFIARRFRPAAFGGYGDDARRRGFIVESTPGSGRRSDPLMGRHHQAPKTRILDAVLVTGIPTTGSAARSTSIDAVIARALLRVVYLHSDLLRTAAAAMPGDIHSEDVSPACHARAA